MTLVDRESEIRELRALADDDRRRLALLYGRRRVGKTFLLNHLWEEERAFYFTASATTPEINRRVLLAEAARWAASEFREEDHPTWRAVFRTLLELRPERPLVVVLDEFQYLASDQEGLSEVASELNAVWEGRLARDAGLLLVLSGSVVRTLEALAAGGSPLYGRLDWRRQLHPFDYCDAGRMVEGYDLLDRVRTYAAFGGMPRYLDAVDASEPLDRNIVRELLHPDGSVRLQLETAVEQEEGFRDVALYRSILASVGLKRRRLGEIAASLGREVDTSLRRMVGQLVELRYLEEERNFEAARNRPIRYRVRDPAIRFYYGMVLPNESGIARSGPRRVWSERLAEEVFPAYVGREVFEDVVRQAYARFGEELGAPPVESWGRWEGLDRDRIPTEVDVVARTLRGEVVTGSVKLRTRQADATVFSDHLDALKRLARSGRAWAHEALEPDASFLFVSASGFKNSFFEAAELQGDDRPLFTWTVEDLYR